MESPVCEVYVLGSMYHGCTLLKFLNFVIQIQKKKFLGLFSEFHKDTKDIIAKEIPLQNSKSKRRQPDALS